MFKPKSITNNLRIMFAGASVAAITLTQMGTALAAYSDVPSGIWYGDAVNAFVDAGYLDASQARFRGGDPANRAEFVKLVVELNGGILATPPAVASFDDVATGAWYYGYFEEAGKELWVRGDGDCYGSHPCYARPGANINRAEAAALIVRAFSLAATGDAPQFVDNPSGQWYTDVIQTAADHCVLQGDAGRGTVRPGDNMNRAEMVVMLHRTDQALVYGIDCGEIAQEEHEEIEENEEIAEELEEAFEDPSEATLVLSLSAANPVGDTVPQGSIGVVMLSVDFTASCADSVAMENLTILHEGFGNVTDIDGIYAAVNGARVTRKRTIDSEDQTSDLRFSSPLVLDPCETVTVDIVGDFSSSATTAAEHNLVVELPSDVFGNAKSVSGNFPLRGDTFRIAAVDSGTVTVTYRTVSPNEIEVGDVGVVLGKFEVSVNSTEDQTFYSMTFEQNSSASDGDFTNVAVRRTDGTILTNTVSQTVGDFVTVVFDPPFTVLEGDKITLEVIGDVVGGAGDSIIIHFEESSDLFAVGSLYGYGVNGQLYGSQVTLPASTDELPDTVNIDAGEFTVGIDGPAQQDYTRDDNDAVLANITFQTGGEDIDVKDLFILIQGTSGTGGLLCGSGGASAATATCATGSDDTIQEVLEDVEIRNKATGRTIDGVRLTGTSDSGQGTNSGAVGTFQIYRFDDFIVRGDETWEFRVDFIDNGAGSHPTNNDKFKIHICGEPTHTGTPPTSNATTCTFGGIVSGSTSYQMQVEGLSTGDKVGDVRPRGNLAGNFHRIANASLTIAGREMATSSSTVQNAKKKSLFEFEAYAGEAEDVLLTQLVFESGNAFSLINGTNYSLWVDTDADGKVDTIIEEGVSAQSGLISFRELLGGGYVVQASERVVFQVKADIASSYTGTNPELQIRFNTGAIFVEAEELDDGSSLSSIRTFNPAGDVVASNGSYTDGGANAAIQVHTELGIVRKLKDNGNLYVRQSSNPIRNRQLLGGTLTDPLLSLEFLSERESADVTDIVITASGADANLFATVVDHLELFREGEITPFALATTAGCGSQDVAANSMCASMDDQQLVTKKDHDVHVLVRAKMKTDEQGGLSGKRFSLSLDPTASTSTGAVRARGADSSNDYLANDGDSSEDGEVFIGIDSAGENARIVGTLHETVLAKIVNIANANNDANLSAVPPNVYDFAKFRFSAASHANTKTAPNDVVLSGVVFNVTATNVSIGNFKLFNELDSTKQADCTIADTSGNALTGNQSGALLVECSNLVTAAPNTEIDQSEDLVVVLQGNIVNPVRDGTSTSTLQAQLQNFESIDRTVFGTASGNSHIQWIDTEGTVASDGSDPRFFWVEYGSTSVSSVTYQS